MFNQGIITFGGGGIRSINGAPGPAITFAGVSGIFVQRDGNTIFVGQSGGGGPNPSRVINNVAGNDLTLTDLYDIILLDAQPNNVTGILPDATLHDQSGHQWHIKKIDESANLVVISGLLGDTIDFDSSVTLTVAAEAITVVSDGSQYWII